MSPLVVGIGVALVGAVVVWLVASIQRRPVDDGEAQRKLAESQKSSEGPARELHALARKLGLAK